MQVKTPDDAIRLAKQLGFLLAGLADELDIDLEGLEANVTADGEPVLSMNAGELCAAAKALQYGSLGEGPDE